VFLVHVDKRTDDTQYQKIVAGIGHLGNVVFLKRNICHWGDFGLVRATLTGLKYLCQYKVEFDYAFLITGQDYPIKSNNQIETFLSKANTKEFVSYFPLPWEPWKSERGGFERIENWHYRFGNNNYIGTSHKDHKLTPSLNSSRYYRLPIIIPKRTFPKNFDPFGGSQYWCITRECVDYINIFVKQNPKFVNFRKYVDIPDEMFFQTMLLNSPLKDKIIPDNLRCIHWTKEGTPRIWQVEDFEILSRSKALFARKFDESVDSEILDLIDAKLL
jgi:hypothetical protein